MSEHKFTPGSSRFGDAASSALCVALTAAGCIACFGSWALDCVVWVQTCSDCTSSSVCFHVAALFFFLSCHLLLRKPPAEQCYSQGTPPFFMLRLRFLPFLLAAADAVPSNAIRRVRPILYVVLPGQVRPGWCRGTRGRSQPGCMFALCGVR